MKFLFLCKIFLQLKISATKKIETPEYDNKLLFEQFTKNVDGRKNLFTYFYITRDSSGQK